MYTELSFYDADKRQDAVLDTIFQALDKKVSGISVLQHHLALASSFLPEGIVLSCAVDYPTGTSLSEVKQHAVISAIRRGANAIDFVLNNSLVIDRKFDDVANEVEAVIRMCRERNVSLRVILEYQLYDTAELLFSVCDMLRELGVEYVYVSSGSIPCDITDSIIVGNIVQKRGLNVINNNGIWLPKQLENIKKSGIFGVRFKSIHAIDNTFGVL